MDSAAINAKLDWLAAQRGNVTTGIPATLWAEAFSATPPDAMHLAALVAVRELLVPEWKDRRREDTRPQAALDATEAWLQNPTPEALAQVKACAKACTAARGETFGDDHRVPEAARAVAWAAGAKDAQHIYEALSCVEAELLARIALTAEYHRGPEQRRALLGVVRRVLVPPPKEPEPVTAPKTDGPPVPYSPEAHFELGQRIDHKKFGSIVVVSVGETWIEAELGDGTKKRLAHKPKA